MVKSFLAIWDKFDKWVILRNTQNQEIKQIKPTSLFLEHNKDEVKRIMFTEEI